MDEFCRGPAEIGSGGGMKPEASRATLSPGGSASPLPGLRHRDDSIGCRGASGLAVPTGRIW